MSPVQKSLSIFALFFCALLACPAAYSSPEVLSFASWKKQRVDQAKLVHTQLLELRRSKLALTKEEELRLRRARMKLLMMEELTPTDYLQQYLVRNYPNNFKVLESAAAKMKPTEVAEIMRAYTNLAGQKQEVETVGPGGLTSEEQTPLFPRPDFGQTR